MSSNLATRIKLSPTFWQHDSCVPFSNDVVPSSLFLRNRHYLVFDIETQQLIDEVGGWSNLKQLRISVACAYDSKTDSMLTFRESELKDLIELCYDRLVIGYNVRGFDLPILSAYGLDLAKVDVFDIMYELQSLTRQRYLKLESVARGTLNAGKFADGLKAVEWWKEGKIDNIIEYCLQDVQVTKDVFEHGRQKGFIKIRFSDENIKEIPVQWN